MTLEMRAVVGGHVPYNNSEERSATTPSEIGFDQ